MRKNGLVFVLALLVLLPIIGQAQSGFSGAYIGKFTTQERGADDGATEQQMRLYNRILLQYEPSENFALKTALRRADYFQESIGNTHLYYAYADWAVTQNIGVMVGRQYPYNKMIRRAIDGLSLDWQVMPHWSIEGIWGLYTPYDRAGLIENPEDEHGYYMGLRYTGNENSTLRASGYQQVSQGRILNFAGMDGRYADLWGINLYGFFKYNITQNFVQEAEGQLRRQFGENFSVSAAYKYRDPNFDLPEWYWQFAVEPYTNVRAGFDWFLTRTGSLSLEYFTRMMTDETIRRYKLGWVASDWTAGVVYAANEDGTSEEWNAYGSIQHRFGKSLLVGAGVDYFDYVFNETYEEPLNAFGSNVFARYRFGNALTTGLRLYYLTNPQYSNDVRLLGELSYQF
ncbi:MAG: hypothetical protein K9N46_14685 [Candidatus Marinimicrobia bacterium]|nr:hypothetical protein [Candidatus Neomarinimicrobiota bacterium]MCF7828486.1 hypothetical protein [Candidatus Neomarinimicrobiota bacterium]MCF7881976.1 hypothetical protein [Candidatus Neomarinimicrobiota bacterium]